MLQYRSNKCFFHCVLFFGMESVTSLRIILHFSMSSKFRRNGWTFVYRFLAFDSTNNSKQKKIEKIFRQKMSFDTVWMWNIDEFYKISISIFNIEGERKSLQRNKMKQHSGYSANSFEESYYSHDLWTSSARAIVMYVCLGGIDSIKSRTFEMLFVPNQSNAIMSYLVLISRLCKHIKFDITPSSPTGNWRLALFALCSPLSRVPITKVFTYFTIIYFCQSSNLSRLRYVNKVWLWRLLTITFQGAME